MPIGRETAASAAAERTTSSEARAALMRAVVQCIAEKGVAGAPLTVIHAAAGQKNMSATHYHFGSREGLINATLDDRMPPLDARRIALLEREIERHGALPPLRDIVSAWIHPLADELRPRQGGNFYLRFLDHLRHESAAIFASRIVALQPGYRTIFSMIDRHLEGLPPAVRRSRIALAAEQVISSLARLETDLQALPSERAAYPATAVELLIDYISGGLAAPLSPASEALLETPSVVDFHLNFAYHANGGASIEP